jgi:hypothetical protein
MCQPEVLEPNISLGTDGRNARDGRAGVAGSLEVTLGT